MSETDPTPHGAGRTEVAVVGLESCRALFAHRRQDIRKVYLLQPLVSQLGELLRWCAAQRLSYTIVAQEALERIAGTPRHDGICVVARRKELLPWETVVERLRGGGPRAWLLLDAVKNPNNVGAVLRVSAFFGADTALTFGDTPGFTAATLRTAQGGGEVVDLARLDSHEPPAARLQELKRLGLVLVATSSHQGEPLGEAPLPERSLLLVGGENQGLSAPIKKAADLQVAIPGAGRMESLNLSCAASVLLWEHWRSHRKGDAAAAPPPTSAPQRRPAPAKRGKARKPRR